MSGLSDYLNSLNTDGWSLRRIAKEAEKHGHQIDHTTVRKYINGIHGTPSPEALEALAAAFRVDINTMRNEANRAGVGDPFDLGAEASALTGPQREAVRHVVRVMLDTNNQAMADPPVGDGATSSQDDYGLAAMAGVSELEQQDAVAARRGEESQDPEDWK